MPPWGIEPGTAGFCGERLAQYATGALLNFSAKGVEEAELPRLYKYVTQRLTAGYLTGRRVDSVFSLYLASWFSGLADNLICR